VADVRLRLLLSLLPRIVQAWSRSLYNASSDSNWGSLLILSLLSKFIGVLGNVILSFAECRQVETAMTPHHEAKGSAESVIKPW